MHKFLFYNKFIICLYMFPALCAHHQEVKIVLYSIWYHHTCRWPSRAQCPLSTCALYWDTRSAKHQNTFLYLFYHGVLIIILRSNKNMSSISELFLLYLTMHSELHSSKLSNRKLIVNNGLKRILKEPLVFEFKVLPNNSLTGIGQDVTYASAW